MHKKGTIAVKLRVSEWQWNSNLWIECFFEMIRFVKYILTQRRFIGVCLKMILHSSPFTLFSYNCDFYTFPLKFKVFKRLPSSPLHAKTFSPSLFIFHRPLFQLWIMNTLWGASLVRATFVTSLNKEGQRPKSFRREIGGDLGFLQKLRVLVVFHEEARSCELVFQPKLLILSRDLDEINVTCNASHTCALRDVKQINLWQIRGFNLSFIPECKEEISEDKELWPTFYHIMERM